MEIRYGNPKDADILAKIGARTFYDAYVEHVDANILQEFVNKTFSAEMQFEEINDANTIFLIAEVESKMAGYAKLVLNTINGNVDSKMSLEISRIYLLQDYIGKGIGKKLMARTLQEAKQRGCNSVWLGVWEKNEKAIRFYEKIGFRQVGSHPFEFGEDEHNDLIMELELTSCETIS